MTVTSYRLKVLSTIEGLCEETPAGLISPRELSDELEQPVGNIRMMVQRLRKAGFLERPYEGCYRLSAKGHKVLKEAKELGNCGEFAQQEAEG